MPGKWSYDSAKQLWEARMLLPDGTHSHPFAEVDRTRLGWHWLRWPTRDVPYPEGCTMSGVEPTREEAMRAALAERVEYKGPRGE